MGRRQVQGGKRALSNETVNSETRMLIDGGLVDGEAGTFPNINPATEEEIGVVADASRGDMLRAIDGARRAFDDTDWSTNGALRKRCLEQLHAALEADKEALREELIIEVGCPRMVTHGPQLDAPLSGALTYPAKLIDEYPWELVLDDEMSEVTGQMTTRRIWREAVGVVGAIVPWNYPFEVTINKIGQALATGNTVVLKPAPDTPFNATRLGRLIAEQTDIPAGVVNVVTSSDHLLGEELTVSPKVDLISFTGSTVVGKRIMHKGADTMKRLFLELGGKSATIVPRRRRSRAFLPDWHRSVHARRSGLCGTHPDAVAALPLRRRGRDPEGNVRECDTSGDPRIPACCADR